jgi:hypothetical protein
MLAGGGDGVGGGGSGSGGATERVYCIQYM